MTPETKGSEYCVYVPNFPNPEAKGLYTSKCKKTKGSDCTPTEVMDSWINGDFLDWRSNPATGKKTWEGLIRGCSSTFGAPCVSDKATTYKPTVGEVKNIYRYLYSKQYRNSAYQTRNCWKKDLDENDI